MLAKIDSFMFRSNTNQEVVTLISPLRKGVATNFWVYSHIFSKLIWGLLFLTLLLVGLVFFLLERIEGGSANILTGMAMSGLLFLQLDYPSRRKSIVLRVFYMGSTIQ